MKIASVKNHDDSSKYAQTVMLFSTSLLISSIDSSESLLVWLIAHLTNLSFPNNKAIVNVSCAMKTSSKMNKYIQRQ